jgi:outer membrane protein assembly factor BamB
MRNILIVGSLLLGATALRAEDWPQWLGPRRDGSSTDVVKPWKEPLKIAWTQPLGEGHGAPIVAKGKVYIHARVAGMNEEALLAFDADSGKPLWNASYPRPETKIPFGNGPRGCPAISNGKLYSYGITGILTCCDAETGKIVWQVDAGKEYNPPALTFGCSCSPLVEGDVVLVNIGAKGASIVAFDKNAGKEVWKALNDGATYSSPIAIGAGETRQIIFLTAKGLVSLAPATGKVNWQQPFVDLLSESSTTPVVIGDTLFGSSITAGGIALKLDGQNAPAKLWAKPALNCYFSTPVSIGKDHLYLVTGSLLTKRAALRCVDVKSGDILWTRDKVGAYHASLVRTGDDKLLLIEEAGNMALLDPNPKEYRELARTKVCGETWAHPAIANGRLYIRDKKDLVCVELGK